MDPQSSGQLPVEPTPESVEQSPASETQVAAAPSSDNVSPANSEDLRNPAEYEQPVDEPAFSWQASEYIQHHKGLAWYVLLGVVVLIFVIVAAILKLWLGIALFLVMGAAIAVYAKKEPRILNYSLDTSGVTIEGKHYPYNSFRSFSVFQDIEWHSIELDPTQRFMPRLTLLFSDDDIADIADHLSLHLPHNDRQPDFIERITRRLRF